MKILPTNLAQEKKLVSTLPGMIICRSLHLLQIYPFKLEFLHEK